ncbi:MAG: ATP-binding protein [Fusobacterium sp.]|nr:ATP-binding protein [Fusobacterium sp.]
MLLQYDIENNLSIKSRQRVAFIADNKKELVNSEINILGYKVLPVIGLYGKNASGKTNLLKGLKHIYDMVILSHSFDPARPIPFYTPFAFTNEKNKESKFEITFMINEKRYVYGFSHDSLEIKEEYLYVFNSSKPSKIFDKDINTQEVYTFGQNYSGLKDYVGKTHKNKLFLSTAAQWAADQKEINDIYNFFRNGMVYYQKDCGIPSVEFENETTSLLIEDENARKFFKTLISYLDLEIEDIKPTKIPVDLNELPEEVKKIIEAARNGDKNLEATSVKTLYNINGVNYDLDLKQESNGIQKIYQLFPLLYHGLNSKKIIVIDEIETGLHPLLIKGIIKLFQNKNINKYNSQLFFTTHITNILDLELLRRDQIWFTERELDNEYSTEVYSLADVKGVRTSDNIEKEYLKGEYTKTPREILWSSDKDE